ncbi:MAG TPA: acyl-CoA dehydrogenase family protein [Actinomycetota bacterium]
MDPFVQEPPQPPDRFREDRPLRHALERLLPAEVFEEALPELAEMAAIATGELQELANRAEANPPRHVPFDAWGRRVDLVEVDPAWTRLVEIGQERGVVALPYEDRFGEHARVVQMGLLSLYLPVSATANCPLAMTDAAVRVLLNEDPELAERYVPRLTARSDAWASGQWMTETTGGSDVGRTETVASDRGDGTWALRGTKWFTSATTADVALALGRPEGSEEGSRGLSLFLLELRDGDRWNGITVRRLKDKMGTRALPTAELDLDGTVAAPVGGIGRGVAKIAAMLNVTRLHAAAGSLGAAGYGLSLARDYAGRREAFGRKLADLPVHRGWIARVAAEYEAMNALAFRAAELQGAVEQGSGVPELARVTIPLTKMALGRQGVWATSHLIESFGGMGYLEDSGLPRLLRDAHVQSIWEGTTSVLALDVLRALGASGVAEAFGEDVAARTRAATASLLEEPAARVLAALETLRPMMAEPDEPQARRLAWGMARTYQAALLCEAADWALDVHGDDRAATALKLFASEPLVGEEPPADPDALGRLAFGR